MVTDEIWPKFEIMDVKKAYIATITREIECDITNNTYIIEKTPFNYYLPHLAFAFGQYFSSTLYSKYPIGNILYSHKMGTKCLAILRDPCKRLISWHSMKEKWSSLRKSMDYYVLNLSRNDETVREFRSLIIHRKDEYDDTLIMLKYMKWIYDYGIIRRGPFANIWLSRYMLIGGMDYPVLLIWIYWYKQMNLLNNLKVIGFNYMINNFKIIMKTIRCWIEDDILFYHQCIKRHYGDFNRSLILEHKNKYAKPKSLKVMRYMNKFYKPLKEQTSKLIKRTNVVLGVWNNSDITLSW